MKIRTPDTRKTRQIRGRDAVWFTAPYVYLYKKRWSGDPEHTGFRYCQMAFGQVDSTWKLSNKNT